MQRLCAAHFEDSEFTNPSYEDRLNWNAVPTLFDIPNPPPRKESKRAPPKPRILPNEVGTAEISKEVNLYSHMRCTIYGNCVPINQEPAVHVVESSSALVPTGSGKMFYSLLKLVTYMFLQASDVLLYHIV